MQRIYYPTLHRIHRLRERFPFSTNSSSIDLTSRTGDRRYEHRTLQGNLHQQLDDSPPTQRKQQDQHQKRSTTGRYISPKLFTAALETIFRRLTWETRGLKTDGEYISNLRFADDVLICANTPHELQQMLQELADESDNQAMKMTNRRQR